MPYRSLILLIGLLLPLSSLLHAQSSLALSSASVPPGGATALNLSLTSDPSNQPAALEWTFSYPTASVANLSVDAGPALSAAGKSLSCSAGAGSYTCVAWGLNSNPISDGVVATLSLTLSSSNSLPVAIGNSLGASLAGDEIAVTGTGGVVSVTAVTGITSITCTPGSLAPSASSTCTVDARRTRRGDRRPGLQHLQPHRSRLPHHSHRLAERHLHRYRDSLHRRSERHRHRYTERLVRDSQSLPLDSADSLVPAMRGRQSGAQRQHHLHGHSFEIHLRQQRRYPLE